MSRFFEISGGILAFDKEPLTFVRCSDDDGQIVVKCIETMDNPLVALSFTDFQLSELIAHGISYNALNISPDLRLGHEKDLTALSERFDELSDKMFVQSKTN